MGVRTLGRILFTGGIPRTADTFNRRVLSRHPPQTRFSQRAGPPQAIAAELAPYPVAPPTRSGQEIREPSLSLRTMASRRPPQRPPPKRSGCLFPSGKRILWGRFPSPARFVLSIASRCHRGVRCGRIVKPGLRATAHNQHCRRAQTS